MSRVAIVREAVVKVVRLLTEKKVTVTQRGTDAYVQYDPDTGAPAVVNIPFIAEGASEEFLDAIQGFMDHEVAHVLFSDFAALKDAKAKKVAGMHNLVEDAFIERQMSKSFAGSAYNLRRVAEWFVREYTDKQIAAHPEKIDAMLLMPAVRAWSGHPAYADYMADKWDKIPQVVDKLSPLIPKFAEMTCSADAVALAVEIKRLLRREDEPEPDEPGKGEPTGSSGEPGETADGKGKGKGKGKKGEAEAAMPADEDDEGTGSGGSESDEREDDETDGAGEGDEADGEGSGRGPDGDPMDADPDDVNEGSGDDEDMPVSEGGGAAVKASDDLYDVIERELTDFDDVMAKLISDKAIDEAKDIDYLIYSTDFDIIEPMPVPEGHWHDHYLTNLADSVDHLVGPLQKDLERAIAARSMAVWSGGHRSGRLHAAALSKLAVGDERVFRRKHESNSKDVAVSLLVDCSGSMSSRGKIRQAAYAAYALAQTLERIGIPFEALGFTTKYTMPGVYEAQEKLGRMYGRDYALYIPVFKGFHERLRTETRRRFAMLPEVHWLCENVDGESVDLAAKRLAARQEKRKILMVFSDGQPCCPGDARQQVTHLKKTVKAIEGSGIDVLGIGIGDTAVSRYYSKHVVLTNLSELPTTVMAQIKQLLMKA